MNKYLYDGMTIVTLGSFLFMVLSTGVITEGSFVLGLLFLWLVMCREK